jgi:site-specific recombinase XerD
VRALQNTASVNPVNRIVSKNEVRLDTPIGDGITLLFDSEFNPITDMNLFILSRKDNRQLYNTANGYADDLANWEMFCHYHGIERRKASCADVEYYHSLLEGGVSAKTRKGFTKATIARRIGTVKSYYKFSVVENFISDTWDAPHHYRGRINGEKKGNKTRFIDRVALGRILDALGPPPTNTELLPTRDRTVAEFLLGIGGRLEDAADLKLVDVLNWSREFEASPHKFLIEHSLTGKNGTRTVLILRPLVKQLMRYIESTRAQIVEAALARKKPGWRAPSRVFLNSMESNNRDIGEAVSRDTLGRGFVEGVKGANLFTLEERVLFDNEGSPITQKGEYETEQVLIVSHGVV